MQFVNERQYDFEAARKHMVLTQLAARDIVDQRVLTAMSQVEREEFVAAGNEDLAYRDSPLCIECDQTISQPYTVAFMAQAAQIREGDKVLEIGTGSGYGAAVLGLLAREVHTIERFSLLADLSSERLDSLGYDNVQVHEADGTLGWPRDAPYDAIVVTAGAKTLPDPYAEQLSNGGRIVIPIGATTRGQTMYRFTLRGDDLVKENLGAFGFVPLVGELGW
jgi:protein-L-isoaspartate(D-aspartate) O-methyltransferase